MRPPAASCATACDGKLLGLDDVEPRLAAASPSATEFTSMTSFFSGSARIQLVRQNLEIVARAENAMLGENQDRLGQAQAGA